MESGSQRFTMVVALEVTDAGSYERYRTAMTPILTSYGGDFGYDFAVEKVLRSPQPGAFNRLFTISFPDRDAKDRFFADKRYGEVRAAHFEDAVAATAIIAEFSTENA